MFGDLTADAQICLEYRDKAGVLVMDIDYRLAPGWFLVSHASGKNEQLIFCREPLL